MTAINYINDLKKIVSESGKYKYTIHNVPLEALLKYKMSKLR
jgi:hypothetical protein